MSGNNVSHSKVRTRRRFMPNLQRVHVVVADRSVRRLVCTRCIRTQSKVRYPPAPHPFQRTQAAPSGRGEPGSARSTAASRRSPSTIRGPGRLK